MGLLLIAVLAVGIMAAGSASAAKEKPVVKLSTAAGPLVAGQEIRASSSDLVTVTAAGNLECSSNVLTGTLTINNAVKDKGSITSEASTGEEGGGACHTTTVLGPAVISATGFPWPLELNTKKQMTLKGTKKVIFTATFPAAGGVECNLEGSKIA
ncbi:MAG TPA: hypothetical protein VF380_04915, partial [Solirubrobacteraceae bacterium]